MVDPAEPTGRRQLAPFEVDARPVILAGTVGWLVALVVLAAGFHHQLAAHHATWWLWACGIGAVLGGYGYYFALRHPPPRPESSQPD